MNLSYGISIISIVRDGMISWISEVEYYSILSLELEDDKFKDKFKNLYQAYVTLMEAFDIFKKIFKFTVRLSQFVIDVC